MPERRVRVALADDHPVSRNGIRHALESEAEMVVVGEATDGIEAVRLCEELHPDLLLLDIHMPSLSGAQVIEKVLALHPDIRIVVLTGDESVEHARALISLGAQGYLCKTVSTIELTTALRAVLAGQMYLQSSVIASLCADPLNQQRARLTPREYEVLHLVAEGLRNRDIARRLNTTERTMQFHIANLLNKTGVTNRAIQSAIAWRTSTWCLAVMPRSVALGTETTA